MTRNVRRTAAVAGAAVIPLLLFGGAAQAGDPQDQDGEPGEAGTGTVHCRWVPPTQDGVAQCTALPGAPGAGGPAADY